jgi:tmRNA-binding protein
MTRTEIKKLLLNRKEITKIEKKLEDKGTTTIALGIFVNNN